MLYVLAGRKSWYLKGAVAPVHTMFQVPVQRQTQSVWCKMPEGSLLQIYRFLMSTVTATITCSLPGSLQPIPTGFLQLNKSCRNMAHKTAWYGGDEIIVKHRPWSRCSLADGNSYDFQVGCFIHSHYATNRSMTTGRLKSNDHCTHFEPIRFHFLFLERAGWLVWYHWGDVVVCS